MHFDECKCGRELGPRGGVAFLCPNYKKCEGAWCAYCVDSPNEDAIASCDGCQETFCSGDCLKYYDVPEEDSCCEASTLKKKSRLDTRYCQGCLARLVKDDRKCSACGAASENSAKEEFADLDAVMDRLIKEEGSDKSALYVKLEGWLKALKELD
jgi:hypothetical protein